MCFPPSKLLKFIQKTTSRTLYKPSQNHGPSQQTFTAAIKRSITHQNHHYKHTTLYGSGVCVTRARTTARKSERRGRLLASCRGEAKSTVKLGTLWFTRNFSSANAGYGEYNGGPDIYQFNWAMLIPATMAYKPGASRRHWPRHH